MSKVTFSLLLQIYRNVVFESNTNGGLLELSSQDLRDTLALLLRDENLDDSGIGLITGDPDRLVVGQTVRVQIDSPRIGLGVLANDLEGLLKTRKAHIEEPKRYFLIKSKYGRGDPVAPSEVQLYHKILTFISLLKESAAYLDSDREEVVFIHEGKFALPLNYEVSDLLTSDLSEMKKIEEAFTSDTHREQKLVILADAAISIVKSTPPMERFKYLLSHISELQKKFSDGYKLFVSNFSYDKVRSDLEAAKIEYTGKIHKIFSDIQNQVVGIPVATVIIATQMKDAGAEKATSYETWVNSAVLLGCWIFVILVSFLICNQRHTLEVLDSEITRQKELIKKNYQAIAPNFNDIFQALDKRLRLQRYILWAISFVLMSGFVLAHFVFFSLTPDAWNWIKSIICK